MGEQRTRVKRTGSGRTRCRHQQIEPHTQKDKSGGETRGKGWNRTKATAAFTGHVEDTEHTQRQRRQRQQRKEPTDLSPGAPCARTRSPSRRASPSTQSPIGMNGAAFVKQNGRRTHASREGKSVAQRTERRYLVVVRGRGNEVAKLWVCPCHLPHGALVSVGRAQWVGEE